MGREHRNQFYRGNVLYLAAGFIISVVALIPILAFGSFDPQTLAATFGIIIPQRSSLASP